MEYTFTVANFEEEVLNSPLPVLDENMTIAQKYRVASIPNFVIFRDGQPVANFVGAMSEADFREKLEQVIL